MEQKSKQEEFVQREIDNTVYQIKWWQTYDEVFLSLSPALKNLPEDPLKPATFTSLASTHPFSLLKLPFLRNKNIRPKMSRFLRRIVKETPGYGGGLKNLQNTSTLKNDSNQGIRVVGGDQEAEAKRREAEEKRFQALQISDSDLENEEVVFPLSCRTREPKLHQETSCTLICLLKLTRNHIWESFLWTPLPEPNMLLEEAKREVSPDPERYQALRELFEIQGVEITIDWARQSIDMEAEMNEGGECQVELEDRELSEWSLLMEEAGERREKKTGQGEREQKRYQGQGGDLGGLGDLGEDEEDGDSVGEFIMEDGLFQSAGLRRAEEGIEDMPPLEFPERGNKANK